jgi:hypothetical protein
MSKITHCLNYIISSRKYRQRREHGVFRVLLQMVPGLEDRLIEGSEEDIMSIAVMVSRSFAPWC